MGEKEPENAQAQREAGSGMATGLAAPAGGGATPSETSNLNLSKAGINRGMGGGGGPGGDDIAIGDPGVNGNITDGSPDPAETAINSSHSNIKNEREMGGGRRAEPGSR